MEQIEKTEPLTADEAIGLDILARDERTDGAITMEEATRIARTVGWPPPMLDDEGQIRPPTPAELARWQSTDPAIVDALEWTEIGEELAHRAPASYTSALATHRELIRALRDRDYHPTFVDPGTAAAHAAGEDIGTVIEIAPGIMLVADADADANITAELVTNLRAIAARPGAVIQ